MRPTPFASILFAVSLVCAVAVRPAMAQTPTRVPDIDTSLLYHALPGGQPATSTVPGEDFPFLQVPEPGSDAPVVIHVLTPTNFAGDLDEQVYVRWWDGRMAHWIMGYWVKNIPARAIDPSLPAGGQMDLWRIEVPSFIWQHGDQFYAIQAKGYRSGQSVERYLLARAGGDFSRTNLLGQVWSSSEEFDGQDWRIELP